MCVYAGIIGGLFTGPKGVNLLCVIFANTYNFSSSVLLGC